jgi:hypothetical protein
VRLSGTDPSTLRCRIGSTGNSMVSGLVRLLSEDTPEATVIPHTSWSAQEPTDMVATGKLDFAIVGVCGDMQPPSEHGLEWRLSDLRAYPLAGLPLRWRHLIGWHPEAPADGVADKTHQYAMVAYTDSLRHSPTYARWLARHPRFGAQTTSENWGTGT